MVCFFLPSSFHDDCTSMHFSEKLPFEIFPQWRNSTLFKLWNINIDSLRITKAQSWCPTSSFFFASFPLTFEINVLRFIVNVSAELVITSQFCNFIPKVESHCRGLLDAENDGIWSVHLPYWFGITSGSVSSPSGGSWSFISWWCRESLFTLVQLLIIGVETPHDGTVTVRVCCCVASNWQSAGTTGNCVCFADLIFSSAFLQTQWN